jgi:sensor histidine kinase YesM
MKDFINRFFYRTLVSPNLTIPIGALNQFQLKSFIAWPTVAALVITFTLYFFAAQTWLLYAYQLWLGYAAGALALALLTHQKGVRVSAYLILPTLLFGTAVGAFVGSFIWFWAIGFGTFRWPILFEQWWQPMLFGLFFCAITIVGDYVKSERAIAKASAIRAQQVVEHQRQVSAKQAAEAQLQLLQAQIEPHFLLNTLANVRSLVNRDTARARDMLDHLSDYLQVALPRMRQSHSTLAREAALSASFLSIMQIRMGARLTFSFDIAANAKDISFPPMLLQTLVENSIKHGLEPLAEPAHIAVHAMLDTTTNMLIVSVADTGIGFGQANTSGSGIGLVNIRERLLSLYGDNTNAQLTITANTPRGVIATLTIPIEGATANAT